MWAALTVAAAPLEAQRGSLAVEELSPLALGTVIAGETRIVDPVSTGAGRYRVSAPAGTALSILVFSPGGLDDGREAVELLFGPGSGAWSPAADPGSSIRFDPGRELKVIVPPEGTLYIWLGVRIEVPAHQSTGHYLGRFTLSVTAS